MQNRLPIREIQSELAAQYPEMELTDYQIRMAIGELAALSEEQSWDLRLEITRSAHNQHHYKLYRPRFGLNEARMLFDSISINRFLSSAQK